jgi:hypothetical protein
MVHTSARRVPGAGPGRKPAERLTTMPPPGPRRVPARNRGRRTPRRGAPSRPALLLSGPGASAYRGGSRSRLSTRDDGRRPRSSSFKVAMISFIWSAAPWDSTAAPSGRPRPRISPRRPWILAAAGGTRPLRPRRSLAKLVRGDLDLAFFPRRARCFERRRSQPGIRDHRATSPARFADCRAAGKSEASHLRAREERPHQMFRVSVGSARFEARSASARARPGPHQGAARRRWREW